MMMVPARAQTAMPRGRWAPSVGVYPPPAPKLASSPLLPSLLPPPEMPTELLTQPLPAPPPSPPPPPPVFVTAAEGIRSTEPVGGGGDGGESGQQPSVPSPNQNLASLVDAALTGVGMLMGGPMAMLGAIPAMAALSTLENPQPTLGPIGAIGQLMGYPTVGQMFENMVGGWGLGVSDNNAPGGGNTVDPATAMNAFAINDPFGYYDFATDTWGGGGGNFGGIADTAGSLAGSATDSMGNPVI